MRLAQLFTLPADWYAQLTNGSQAIITPSMPLVLLLLGIFIAIIALGFIVGLTHKK